MASTLHPARAGSPMRDDSTATPGNDCRTAMPGEGGAAQRTLAPSDPVAQRAFWQQRRVRIATAFVMAAVLGTVMVFTVRHEVRSQAVDQPRLLLSLPHPMGAYRPSETLPPAAADGDASTQQHLQQYPPRNQQQHEPSAQPAKPAHEAPAGRNLTNAVPLQRSQRLA